MRLSSLEIQGFKSFPDKTKIDFDKGLTVVVGPNGSGKSNISDAMRWVLGEQSTKTLRGGKMEDVIFAGTSARKPMGSATVSLTFDNTDRTLPVEEDQVTITRRYYRSGESEYLLNGKPMRLRDLNEMLMDTGLGKDGYSMIGQGRIAEIISAKSRERREIFEEAAGIAKYRYRREEAEHKLSQAQENLLRLYDILSELEGRVEPLKEQSEKAEKFLALSEEKKKLEITLWLQTLDKFRADLRQQEDKCLIARGDAERLEAEAARIEQQISDTYQKTQDCLTKSDEYRQIRENLQNRIAARNAEQAVHENERTHALLEYKRIQTLLEDAEAARQARAAEILQAEGRCTATEERLSAMEQQEAETRALQQQLLTRGKSFDQEAGDIQSEISRLTLDISRSSMTISSDTRTLEEEEERLSQQQQQSETAAGKIAEQKKAMEDLDGLLTEIEERRTVLQNSLAGFQLKLDGKQAALQKLQQQYQDLDLEEKGKLQRASLLNDLEENFEGFAHSVKAVMGWQKHGQQKGIHGTVAQLLQVPEEYALAIETALGGALQNIVVADEETAKACIRRLQRDRAGRATFLPLTSVKGNDLSQPGLDREPGYLGLASELVRYDPAYAGIVRFLLGRIVIAENLDDATEMAKKNRYRFRVVTLDGQQVNVGGSFTGGSAARNQGLLSRRGEADKLRAEAAAIHKQKETVSAAGKAARAEYEAVSAQMEGARSELIVAGEDMIRFEGEKKRCEAELSSAQEQVRTLETALTQSREKIEALRQEIAAARETLAADQAKRQTLSQQLSSRQGSQDELSGQLEQVAASLSELSIQRVVLQKDLETARAQVVTLRQQSSDAAKQRLDMTEQLEALQQKAEELEQEVRRCKEDVDSFTQQIADYAQKNEAMLALRQQLEGETVSLRQQAREAAIRKEKAAGETARLDEQKMTIQRDYDQLVSRLWEEYELTPREASALRVELAEPGEGSRRLGILKNEIKALGSINVAAIEEYKEVSQRYAFLKEQVADAANARDELLRLIDSLTDEMKQIFGDAFKQINKNFGEIFRTLFGGGSAELRLDDPEDILECGIEIIVQPPGKIIKNLAALSGGEQAMVAVAIYFAILKVRPSPFCVLDEIEAALDDVNVTRYAGYLRSICDKTQFILITHRRGTMEEADVLYGVTMQESGVSKLLQLQVSKLAADNG